MQKPIVIFAYLIMFSGLFSMISALVGMSISPRFSGGGEGMMLGVIANCAGSALLYVDRRLNEIEAKVDSLSAAADSSSPE